jgi:alpha-1,3-rhamnosyl/mannosyltransferase
MQQQNGVSLVSAGYRTFCGRDVFPGIEDGVDLGHYARNAVLSALGPLYWPGERKLASKADLYHATDHLIPKFSKLPVVATIMDTIPLSHPEWIHAHFLSGPRRWLWRHTGRWADHVLTISKYSKQEITQHFHIAPERITVVPLGVHPRFFEPIDAACRKDLIERLVLPERFFLTVGTLQPRKNLERVLDAHASLPVRLQRDVPVVVVGRPGWDCESLVVRMNDPQVSPHVRWLCYLPDQELRALMQTATALVFPSLYEGFGLPVIEAFASGLPVITSNTTSLPEVAGEAALLIDPQNTGEIALAMRTLTSDDSLAERLRTAGMKRARELNWETCAARTLAVYKQIV